jgi:hypothetical protein
MATDAPVRPASLQLAPLDIPASPSDPVPPNVPKPALLPLPTDPYGILAENARNQHVRAPPLCPSHRDYAHLQREPLPPARPATIVHATRLFPTIRVSPHELNQTYVGTNWRGCPCCDPDMPPLPAAPPTWTVQESEFNSELNARFLELVSDPPCPVPDLYATAYDNPFDANVVEFHQLTPRNTSFVTLLKGMVVPVHLDLGNSILKPYVAARILHQLLREFIRRGLFLAPLELAIALSRGREYCADPTDRILWLPFSPSILNLLDQPYGVLDQHLFTVMLKVIAFRPFNPYQIHRHSCGSIDDREERDRQMLQQRRAAQALADQPDIPPARPAFASFGRGRRPTQVIPATEPGRSAAPPPRPAKPRSDPTSAAAFFALPDDVKQAFFDLFPGRTISDASSSETAPSQDFSSPPPMISSLALDPADAPLPPTPPPRSSSLPSREVLRPLSHAGLAANPAS